MSNTDKRQWPLRNIGALIYDIGQGTMGYASIASESQGGLF